MLYEDAQTIIGANTSSEVLADLVATKDLSITHIVSPPRTLSTVVEIALSEGADGQVNEPFHTRSRIDFEDGCWNILKRVAAIKSRGETKRVVIKDLAKHIDEAEWLQILQFIQAVILVIREPTLQFHSLISRRVTDILMAGREASPKDVISRVRDLPEEAWHDTSWNKLELFLKEATVAGLPIGTVSGLTLRVDPDFTMHELHKIAGHPVSEFEGRTASGWRKSSGGNFYSVPFRNQGPITHSFAANNKWIGSAVRSDSFSELTSEGDQPKPITHYPRIMQEYLLDEVFPVFVRLMTHPTMIVGTDIQTVIKKLAPINPIEAYILAHHPSVVVNNEIRKIHEDLRKELSIKDEAMLDTIHKHVGNAALSKGK